MDHQSHCVSILAAASPSFCRAAVAMLVIPVGVSMIPRYRSSRAIFRRWPLTYTVSSLSVFAVTYLIFLVEHFALLLPYHQVAQYSNV